MIDMAGLAQKGGAVYSYLRIAERPEDIHAIRVAAGGADLVLGGDIVVAGSKKVLAAIKPGGTAVINLAEFLPGDFTRNADFSLPSVRLKRAIAGATGVEHAHFVDATRLATALLGNGIATNMFLLGYAYQLGALPLSASAIEQALALNGEAVAMNQAAFRWGRRAALDLGAVEALVQPATAGFGRQLSQSLDEMIARRVDFLTAYQNAGYAGRYRVLVDRTQAAEGAAVPGATALTEAVARYLFKLMAYKDEYEVARLYAETGFREQVAVQFAPGALRFDVHLAPPFLSRPDGRTGAPRKITFGPWVFPLFGLLAKFRFLRGTRFDPFGYQPERQGERALIAEYEALLAEILRDLKPGNHATAVALARIPEKIRGFGHVKERHLKAAKADEAALLEQFRSPPAPVREAAE
jgi:indolepyruvate ferredoxin oxidoreductase